MQLLYTQGLIRGQTEPSTTAKIFLQKSGQNVSIYVTDQPLQAVVAHKTKNYFISEPVNVASAWTVPVGACWLYWDINMTTALISRGVTTLAPASGMSAPEDFYTTEPANGQHYFDKTAKQHYYYNAGTSAWVECLRVFVGSISSLGVLSPMPFASQVGLTTPYYTAGYIIYTLAGTPFIDPADSTFVNTGSGYLLKTGANNGLQVDLSYEPLFAISADPLPANTLVAPSEGGLYVAADGPSNRFALGICMYDTAAGTPFKLQPQGLIRGNFEFDPDMIGTTVWLGPEGTMLYERPENYASQAVGTILGTDTLFLNFAVHAVGPAGADGAGSGLVVQSTSINPSGMPFIAEVIIAADHIGDYYIELADIGTVGPISTENDSETLNNIFQSYFDTNYSIDYSNPRSYIVTLNAAVLTAPIEDGIAVITDGTTPIPDSFVFVDTPGALPISGDKGQLYIWAPADGATALVFQNTDGAQTWVTLGVDQALVDTVTTHSETFDYYSQTFYDAEIFFQPNVVLERTEAQLRAWALARAWTLSDVNDYDGGQITTADIIWPDRTPGVYIADELRSVADYKVTDKWHASYIHPQNGTMFIGQVNLPTRNVAGQVMSESELVISSVWPPNIA